jgi:hypothetical protein
MITACLITYNDMPLVKQCIGSIYGQVDNIIAIDGRYSDFPGSEWYSTDGTIEYLQGLDKVDLRFGANLYEANKRNLYLKGLAHDQTVLVIDTDEVVEGNICELNADVGLVKFYDGKHCQQLATRIFKYKDGMKYTGVHFILEVNGRLFNKRSIAEKGWTQELVDDFKMIHLRYDRPDQRQLDKKRYYKKLIQREAKYKKANFR